MHNTRPGRMHMKLWRSGGGEGDKGRVDAEAGCTQHLHQMLPRCRKCSTISACYSALESKQESSFSARLGIRGECGGGGSTWSKHGKEDMSMESCWWLRVGNSSARFVDMNAEGIGSCLGRAARDRGSWQCSSDAQVSSVCDLGRWALWSGSRGRGGPHEDVQ